MVKERFLKAYRRIQTLQIKDHQVLIFQDFSSAVATKRKAFTLLCHLLYDRNIRFQLLYPAKLKVKIDGKILKQLADKS